MGLCRSQRGEELCNRAAANRRWSDHLGKGQHDGEILIYQSFYLTNTTSWQEFAGMKMTTIMSGWSSHGGQTLSPYVGEIEENETLIGHSVSLTTNQVLEPVELTMLIHTRPQEDPLPVPPSL